MNLGITLSLGRTGRGGEYVPPPIELITANQNDVDKGKTDAGVATLLGNLVAGDDVLVVARRASATPISAPAGFTVLATAVGAATSARLFHRKMVSGDLTGGDYVTPNFNSPSSAARVWAIALRYALGFTTGASASNGAARVDRPYSALSGLTARALPVGFTYLSSGAPPVPAGSTVIPGTDSGTVGRMWAANVPTDTWAPAAAADGASLEWLEIAIGVL